MTLIAFKKIILQISLVLSLFFLTSDETHAEELPINSRKLEALSDRASAAEVVATKNYLDGDPAGAVARFESALGTAEWESLFVLGNTLWTMEPERSFQWHKRAYELSGHDIHALLELAYDYTRRDECMQAVSTWERIDTAGLMNSYMPMLAAYCYLKLGDDKRAFTMIDRAMERRSHGRFEQTLEQLWGRRPALREHADALNTFADNGDPTELRHGLQNALRLETGTLRGSALRAFLNAAHKKNNSGDLFAQLECLRPAIDEEIEADDKSATTTYGANISDPRKLALARIHSAWTRQLEKCGLLVGQNSLPNDSAFAKFLVVNALNLNLMSEQELLDIHGKELWRRSNSQRGDLEALRILAALQAKTSSPALKATDELGWYRYGDPKFAASFIYGELQGGDSTLNEEGRAKLKQARVQFPNDKEILSLWLHHMHPSLDIARAEWRELVLMEFHDPTLRRDPNHLEPVATGLYSALREYRKTIGL